MTEPAIAGAYEPDDLAFPLNVSQGGNLTLIVNQTPHTRYMHASGLGPNQPFNYWESINGGTPHEFIDGAGITVMHAAVYNYTFETSGRIAIAYLLSDVCGYQTADTDPNLSCPPFEISVATAFDLLSWASGTRVLRVGGDVDSYFFDDYLNPLGQATERSYDHGMHGLVVVVPHGAGGNVTFSVSPLSSAPLNWVVILVPVFVVLAVSAFLILLARRRRKRGDDQSKIRHAC